MDNLTPVDIGPTVSPAPPFHRARPEVRPRPKRSMPCHAMPCQNASINQSPTLQKEKVISPVSTSCLSPSGSVHRSAKTIQRFELLSAVSIHSIHRPHFLYYAVARPLKPAAEPQRFDDAIKTQKNVYAAGRRPRLLVPFRAGRGSLTLWARGFLSGLIEVTDSLLFFTLNDTSFPPPGPVGI